jgi:hypothetical protein
MFIQELWTGDQSPDPKVIVYSSSQAARKWHKHIATNNKLNNEFMESTQGFMKTFLGMEIEQSKWSIKLNLDHRVREMHNEFKGYIEKPLRPKRVPISPGVVL